MFYRLFHRAFGMYIGPIFEDLDSLYDYSRWNIDIDRREDYSIQTFVVSSEINLYKALDNQQ